ncbi:hypothetical protein SAMN05720606_10436 [Paenibacillus polysaccharolyticus]|uniref:Uncharacterized protein n=1 Tax=Paenibacillus polysaccharolyticus TaxID=582692 RepID=A0A1G5F3B2_9BACL|nr:hypothetical protein [Paenibacillus polysaccharolyticus]SCY33735.1 hypothetical protein SAMN05720606_10436 [Paenibacillus polysaccharolyticus]
MNSNDKQQSPEQAGEHLTEETTQAVHLTQGEIHAIQKALLFLKFECEETSSLLYAGSPLINSALSKLREADIHGDFSKQFHSRPSPHAEGFMRDKLERSYSEEHVPHERTEAQLNDIWQSCMFPFPATSYKQDSDPK